MTKRKLARSAGSILLSLSLVISGITPWTSSVTNVYAAGTKTIEPASGSGEDKQGTGDMDITLTVTKEIQDSWITLSATEFTYNGSTKKPKVAVKYTVAGTVYTLTEGTDYTVTIKDSDNNEVLAPQNAGTYTITVNAKDGSYFTGSGSKTYKINKLAQDTPNAPVLASKTTTSVTLAEEDGCEYSKDGTNWQAGTVFTGLTQGKTYKFYQRVAETSNFSASESSEALAVSLDAEYDMVITLTITQVDVVNNMINKLPEASEVTKDDKADIEAARAAYNALTDEQKANVDADLKTKLVAVEAALAIELLPAEPTTGDQVDIEATRTAYDALTDTQKTQVGDVKKAKLEAAEVGLVKAIINALPAVANVTTGHKNDIEAARAKYDALSDAQKTQVGDESKAKLEAAEAALVKAMITALPDASAVTTANRTDIEAVRAKYDTLNDTQKTQVGNDAKAKLEAVEVALAIDALPNASDVQTTNGTAIDTAKAAYDALSNAQKTQVGDAAKAKLEACVVALAIEKLPAAADVKSDDSEAIEAVRVAYDALSDAQRAAIGTDKKNKIETCENALVQSINDEFKNVPGDTGLGTGNKETVRGLLKAYDELTDANKALVDNAIGRAGIKKLANLEKALDVVDRIDAIKAVDTITLDDEKEIIIARTAYEILPDSAKAMVSTETIAKLEAAEAAIEAKKAQDALESEKISALNRFEDYVEVIKLEDTTREESLDILLAAIKGLTFIGGATTKEEVSTALNQAKDAVDEAIEKINKARALTALIDEAKGKNAADYTKESWEEANLGNETTEGSAIKAANDVLINEDSTTEQINAAKVALQAAIDKLVTTKAGAKNDLDKTIKAAQQLLDENKDTYTKDTVDALDAVLEYAEEVLNDEEATKRQYDTAIEVVVEAVNALKTKAKEAEEKAAAEKTAAADALTALIDEAKDKSAEDYTEASWAEAKLGDVETEGSAIKAANDVLTNENSTTDQINAAKETLQAALDKLVTTKEGAKKDLAAAIEAAQKELDDHPYKYTTETEEALLIVIEEAEEVLLDKEATKRQYNNAIIALEIVFNSLKTVKDAEAEEALEAANIALANAKEAAEIANITADLALTDTYTSEIDKTAIKTAKETLDGKVADANALTETATAEQKDTAAKAIEDAVANLNMVTDVAFNNSLVAQQLDEAKNKAIERFSDYSEAKVLLDATEVETATYEKAVADGKEAIANAPDKEAVKEAFTQAKVAVDAALAKIKKDREDAAAAAAEMAAADKALDDAKGAAEIANILADQATKDKYASETDITAVNTAKETLDGKVAAANELTETATAEQKNEAAQAIEDAIRALDKVIDTAIENSEAKRAAAREAARAAKQLADAKSAAIERLDDYSEAKALADATDVETASYEKAVADGKEAINTATTKEAVTKAFNEAKAAVDAALAKIASDRKDAAAAKKEMTAANKAVDKSKTAAENAKTAADEAAADKYASDADKTAINNAKATVDAKIKAANDLPETATAAQKNEAAKAIEDAVKALNTAVDTANKNSANTKTAEEEKAAAAQELALVKDVSSDRLDDYSETKALKDATEAEKAAYDKAVVDGKEAIAKATDKKTVAEALTQAKAAVDAALANIEKERADAKEAADKKAAEEEATKKAAEELEMAKKVAKNRLEDLCYSKNQNIYRAQEQKEMEAAKDAGNKAIDAATTTEEVDKALEEAKKAINAVKTDFELAKEEKAAADKKASDEKAAADKKAQELAAMKKAAQLTMNEQLKVTQKGNKVDVEWKKVSSADGYYVYAQYCGKKSTKTVKTIKSNATTKITISKIKGKKISTKKNFHVYVAAYKTIDGKKVVIGKSILAHLVGSKSKKYSNVKSLNLATSQYTVEVGKTAKVKATITLAKKNKKHMPRNHSAKFRYRTSDKGIAKVSKNGTVTGVKKGTCTVYVYASNGLLKKATVTVK